MSAQLTAALEALANRVRSERGIQSATQLVVGAQGWTARGQKHGHFAAGAWTNAEGQDVHEILLSGESLKRGAVATAGTLIHELAHLYCFENGIKDTSDSGRWHNQKFKAVAEEFGLTIEKADRIGFSVTTVPENTQRKYAAELDSITDALVAWKRGDLGTAAAKPKQPKWHLVCYGCQDPVPISKKWAEARLGTIVCTDHDEPYELEQL